MINRREFIMSGAVCAGVTLSGAIVLGKAKPDAPSYLKGYEDLYLRDPRRAAIEWFRGAKFGFCLFDTQYTNFSSMHTPSKRDLVSELAVQCQNKGLGLCLYYSHGRDWIHPHAPNNDGWGGSARPKLKDPAYKYGKEHNLQQYLDFMRNQIAELLTNYGPIAAIWLDGIGVPMSPKGNNHKEMFSSMYLCHIGKA